MAHKKGRRRVATGANHPASHHRPSDGGPEGRQRCPDGGPEHRYEWYTSLPLYVSSPNGCQISLRNFCHTVTVAEGSVCGQLTKSLTGLFSRSEYLVQASESILCLMLDARERQMGKTE